MADFSQYAVNLDTPQPGGRQGESPRAAFTKYNDLLGALESELEGITYEHISATAPVETYPFQPWVDTSVNPPMLRRRNADDDAWVAVMPALVPLGTASQKDMPAGVDELGTIIGLDVPAGVDEVYHRLNVVGTVSESGGVPTGALIERGSNSNGEYARWADGTQICWHTHTQTLTWEAYGSGTGLYQTDPALWVYPAEFTGAPALATIVEPDNVPMFCLLNANTPSAASYRAAGPANPGGTTSRTFHSLAIGRWY